MASRRAPASMSKDSRDNVRHLSVAQAEPDRLLELEGRALRAALYDRFAPDVNRIVRSLLGPDPDHDDIVQQVFATAIRKVDDVRDRASLRQWMMTVAANAVRTELRRRWRWRWLRPSADLDANAIAGVDHEARSLLIRFYAVVSRLLVDDRTAFVLRHVEGWSLREIADACDCSIPTVKRRIARGNARFVTLASREPALLERMRAGTTWEVEP